VPVHGCTLPLPFIVTTGHRTVMRESRCIIQECYRFPTGSFCNVWVCVCMGFVMCGCVCVYMYGFCYVCVYMYGFCNVRVCVCMGFVMCGCVYVWVL